MSRRHVASPLAPGTVPADPCPICGQRAVSHKTAAGWDPDEATYRTAVDALFARRPEWMVPGLRRIRAVCASLDHPEGAFPAVHVTGTNGKTSIVRMVSALCGAIGLRVGAYTSPHLHDVRERIQLPDGPITRAALVRGLDALHPHLCAVERRRGEMVTFFETVTALALASFAGAKVDAGVIEVGMGGRWDATNVVDGRVAVIGRVGLDHLELGATVAEIAHEKAGIVKDGAVVVSAVQDPAAATVIEEAVRRRGARLALAGRDFAVADRRPHPGGQRLALQGLGATEFAVNLPLRGGHQADNAALALAAVQGLLGPDQALDPARVAAGFAAVRSPGRLELMHADREVRIVLDGAHNPDGARALAAALAQEFEYRRCVLVVGVLADKDVAGVMTPLTDLAHHVVVAEPRAGRPAASCEALEELARRGGGPVTRAGDVETAVAQAVALADPADLVVVTGSLYTVSEARAALLTAVSASMTVAARPPHPRL